MDDFTTEMCPECGQRRVAPIEEPDPMDEAKRHEWLEDEDRHATWRNTEVEVA